MVKHRTFNHTIVAVGKRGSGKSQWCLTRCLDFAKVPCYILAHDIGKKTPDTLHDGRPTYVRFSDGIDEARKSIARDPRGLHAISTGGAAEVVQLGCDIAEASLAQHGGSKGHPCVIYIDEVVNAEICDTKAMHEDFKRVLMQSRHLHVGLVIGTQSARILNNQLLTNATHLQLFQITDKRDLNRLIECGVDEEVVMQARALPPHKSITVRL